jgi:hypothetical protein
MGGGRSGSGRHSVRKKIALTSTGKKSDRTQHPQAKKYKPSVPNVGHDVASTHVAPESSVDLLSMSDLIDLFSYLLPYPAVLQICDSKLQPFTNLPSKLIITVLLVDSGESSLVIEQREYQFNPTFSWMSP